MKISVVTVSFNTRNTIAQTIASVAEQHWPDVEHIIIDGGSTDGTSDIVASLKHDRLRFVREPDEGMYDAMNKGLDLATGDYVGFLNADDFFASPTSLTGVAKAAIATGSDCIIGDTVFVDVSGRRKGRIYSTIGFRPWWLRLGVMPPHPSFYARTQSLRDIQGFDTRYRIASDFDLVARLLLGRKASWTRLGKIVTCFRVGGISTSGLRTKAVIGREIAASLSRLGQPLAPIAVQLRYPIKLMHVAAGLLLSR